MGRPVFQAYLLTCLVTGKQYVGITARGLNRRWTEHRYNARSRRSDMLIGRAIAKHGAENFRMEALCSSRTWGGICAAEALLIIQHGTKSPQGYNLTDGGEGPFGFKHTPEAIERSAAKHRGRPCHPNTRAAAVRTHLGKPKSAATRAKMAAARTGEVRSAETRAKISAAKMGRSCNVGERNGQAKLTATQVAEARARLATGESQRSIARSFGIHYNAIWKVANGLKWRSVPASSPAP